VKAALAGVVKQGLLASGQYRRTLADLAFPGVAVLAYHGLRGDEAPSGVMPFENLHVRASRFETHCRVVRETCDPISLDDWRAASAGRGALPARPVLMTFDDGYRSVFRIAAPILDAYDLPSVVFVCTDAVAHRRLLWFDQVAEAHGEEEVEGWKARDYDQWLEQCAATAQVDDDDPRALMTSEEIAALSRSPLVEIGSHTARHPILARATRDQQREEIGESLDALGQWTGRPIRAFAYPNGRPGADYTAETASILNELGVDAAFTMRPSFARSTEPPLERSRFLIIDEVTDAELAHRLAYTWPR
jgi:peptidoglycan/xylan/chitin deacetylase (PgdA/CDA1 family)